MKIQEGSLTDLMVNRPFDAGKKAARLEAEMAQLSGEAKRKIFARLDAMERYAQQNYASGTMALYLSGKAMK